MNSINVTGRLTRDPEFKNYTTKGVEKELAKFRLAVTRPGTYGDTKKTDFFNVITYFSAAFCKHLAQGRLVSVTGVMTYSEYEKEGGVKTAYYEIIADNIDSLESGAKTEVVAEVQVAEAPKTQSATQTKRVEYSSADEVSVY